MSKRIHQRGFTLLEIVVAMAIFSVILIITMGAFSRFAIMQRRAIDEQAFQEDVRLAIDLMNREIRTAFGETFEVGAADGIIGLRNQNGICVNYLVEDDRLVRREDTANSLDCLGIDLTRDSTRALTGADSTIIDLQFRARKSLTGLDASGLDVVTEQGFVVVKINAQARARGIPSIIQTTVASQQSVPF